MESRISGEYEDYNFAAVVAFQVGHEIFARNILKFYWGVGFEERTLQNSTVFRLGQLFSRRHQG